MKKHPLAIAVAVVGLALVGCDSKTEQPKAAMELTTIEQKVSYGLGLQWGDRLSQDKSVQLDADAIALGVKDAMARNESRLSDEDMQDAFDKLRKASEEKLAELDKQAQEAGKKYLEENGKREGVVTTESGLQYEVLEKAEGEQPKPDDVVKVNYKGMLTDGTVFDESAKHGGPIDLPLNGGVIAGWLEGLQLMHVGEKAKLYVPSELAYGEQSPSPVIPANSVLVFELELLAINQPQTLSDEVPEIEVPAEQ
ncbi:FKBP-type peptidyl-prolyl cis-trans isomerase [Pseudomonas mangrovi]|jgi:FKBP-type peptidyl-prolyl cis-trans isomerase FklB|uniref:Peptidyl-prolyl cis-trans isomerase n=1 Tax=Pseudomonas mangrovi TaxID=2161748 RepID=A0A2T5PD91_9PSED|nr:FKBP-type peptidyl-prolyl cis-trans isomerase [Pseudomonas mangrovi]PTU75693.1 peptidylprolyl isomerase [Pseudomonas mangrovi]